MKWLTFYKDKLGLSNEDEVFAYLIDTLKPTVRAWNYFVNWDKVFANTQQIEPLLKKANEYLIGKSNFDEAFRTMITQDPSIIKIIPVLIVRAGGNKFEILAESVDKILTYDTYDFTKTNITPDDIELYLTFFKKTGLSKLITDKKITNFVDYVIGVEAGLDSNARKNRSGRMMENIVELFINDFCKKCQCYHMTQASRKKLVGWGYDIPFDKANRQYDFAINRGNELWLIETNFYGGGGSKLKSTAGEYKTLFDLLGNKCRFIWITDGGGWNSAQAPLRETFDHNDYVFNLTMLEKGVLEDLL